MIGSATHARSFGFENLELHGAKEQRLQASSSIRQGENVSRRNGELSPDESRRVDQLKATDRKVRAHEQAHMSVGGDLVRGGAAFSYETGPDQKRYAVAGEVSIDASGGRTPKETVPKAQHIRNTALAPVDPSPQDQRVASLASGMEIEALQEIAVKAAEERGRAESAQGSLAIGAYQQVAGVREATTGFAAVA